MLTKEECFDSVQYLFEHAHKCSNCVHVNIGCDECEQDNTMECDIAHYRLTCLIENYYEIFNPQPYKFEDLKVGMWIWDDKLKIPYKIKKMMHCHWFKTEYRSFVLDAKTEERKYHTGIMEFQENRFYPMTKAMEYQK